MPNALARAISPYLLQHQGNPVDWREWNAETLALAEAEDKPILLSVGYAACHWCHVMAHESFENAEIAALMNRHFINIKVDREERPDIDAIYQQALALLGEQGGWPLTMFLTPDAQPFWGGTYFPPEPRFGRPGFPQVLEQMAHLWRNEREKVLANRDAIAGALQRLNRPEPGPVPSIDEVVEAAVGIGEEFDAVHGGIGGAPKFPHAPVLELVWQAAATKKNRLLQRRVLHALARICQGGIYDHLGGGFARYSVDAFWLVPHFEKMLYDNGQLLGLLGEAYAATGDLLFRERAAETVAWLEREMLTPHGLAASLDADSEGEEGRFYVWQAGEIDDLLGPDAAAFKAAYGVTKAGNWEGKAILHRLHEPGLPRDAAEARKLADCRGLLFEAREGRVRPGRDDKIMADWNGLAIQGLARAAFRMGEPRWLELAENLLYRVTEFLESDMTLHHSGRDGRRVREVFLDDHAQLALAALLLAQYTGKRAWLERAAAWLDRAEILFGRADGSYALALEDTPGLPATVANAHCGPTPSAAGTTILANIMLARLLGEPAREERARRALAAFAGPARKQPFAHATLLRATLAAELPIEIVIIGGRGRNALLDVVRRAVLPPFTLALVDDAAVIPPSSPAAGKTAKGDLATAYLCIGATCRPPVTDAAAFEALLEATAAPIA